LVSDEAAEIGLGCFEGRRGKICIGWNEGMLGIRLFWRFGRDSVEKCVVGDVQNCNEGDPSAPSPVGDPGVNVGMKVADVDVLEYL
jgi:hypothetical protein